MRRSVPEYIVPPKAMLEDELPKGWLLESIAKLLHLGAICDLKDGNHGANHPKVADFVEEGMPFITAAQVSERGTIDYSGAYKLAGKPLSKLRVGFAQAGDVIYTHKGSVGRVALCDRACVLSPQTTYYRVNKLILHNSYLRVFLLSPVFQIQVDAVKKQQHEISFRFRNNTNFFSASHPSPSNIASWRRSMS